MNAISKKKKPINRKKYRPNFLIFKDYLSKRITLKRLAHARPVTGFTGNIWIAPIAIHATTTNRILFEVERFRIWQSINNLAERPYFSALWAHKTT
jgi:hypothetical protein